VRRMRVCVTDSPSVHFYTPSVFAALSPLKNDSAIPTSTREPVTKYAVRMPEVNPDARRESGPSEIATRAGGRPFDAMTAVTMAVTIAMPVTFPEFLTRLRSPDTTPYLRGSTVLKIELLLGALKMPRPPLRNTIAPTMRARGEFSFARARRNSPIADKMRPATLNIL